MPRTRVAVAPDVVNARSTAERAVLEELAAWRACAIADASAPLDADDLVRLLRDCIGALGLDPTIAAGFTVNTVHYYRRKDIIDPPAGRTAAARYGTRHLWQIAGARLAGHLGLVTLAEARDAMRDADETSLLAFLAARVTDARARDSVKSLGTATTTARALAPSATADDAAAALAMVIQLPGEAWCVVPAAHAAHHSTEAAAELLRVLALALRVDPTL